MRETGQFSAVIHRFNRQKERSTGNKEKQDSRTSAIYFTFFQNSDTSDGAMHAVRSETVFTSLSGSAKNRRWNVPSNKSYLFIDSSSSCRSLVFLCVLCGCLIPYSCGLYVLCGPFFFSICF